MPDDKTKKVPRDALRISLTDPDEVRYWCKRFKCVKEDLERAVAAVGHSVAAVEAEIQRIKQRRLAAQRRRRDLGMSR